MVTKDMGSAGRVNLKGVHKSFLLSDGEELEVLKGMDLEIRPREMFSLIGPSGCGKTTLLRLIAGLDIPTSGMVTVDDQPINGPDCKRAFMSQDPNLFPWLNVKRNISFGLEARKKRDGISKDVSRQKISELINMVGLSGFESV
ncbi:MAG: ATP-binding cassette domain-containing protein, partial [Dehalococcoidales bacterium]